MASNARSGSWGGAPAGQPASDDITGEVRVIADTEDDARMGDVTGEVRVDCRPRRRRDRRDPRSLPTPRTTPVWAV